MWTWKTFVKFLVTDKYHSRALSRFYEVVVLERARAIQRLWRGYFARACIVPFTKQVRASQAASPTCVWSSDVTREKEGSKRWYEFLVGRRYSTSM